MHKKLNNVILKGSECQHCHKCRECWMSRRRFSLVWIVTGEFWGLGQLGLVLQSCHALLSPSINSLVVVVVVLYHLLCNFMVRLLFKFSWSKLDEIFTKSVSDCNQQPNEFKNSPRKKKPKAVKPRGPV